jgi:hypothetical protein
MFSPTRLPAFTFVNRSHVSRLSRHRQMALISEMDDLGNLKNAVTFSWNRIQLAIMITQLSRVSLILSALIEDTWQSFDIRRRPIDASVNRQILLFCQCAESILLFLRTLLTREPLMTNNLRGLSTTSCVFCSKWNSYQPLYFCTVTRWSPAMVIMLDTIKGHSKIVHCRFSRLHFSANKRFESKFQSLKKSEERERNDGQQDKSARLVILTDFRVNWA